MFSSNSSHTSFNWEFHKIVTCNVTTLASVLVQFKTEAMCWGKPICILSCFSGFPSVAFETLPVLVWLTGFFFIFFQSKWASTSYLCTFLPGNGWFDVLHSVPKVSQAQHFKSSFKTPATCNGCLACDSIWFVNSLDCSMSRTAYAQESSSRSVKHCYMQIWASNCIFHFLASHWICEDVLCVCVDKCFYCHKHTFNDSCTHTHTHMQRVG